MNYVEINNEVTLKSLETNRTPEVIGSVIQRLTDVYDMCKTHMHEEMTILDIGTKDCLFFDTLKEKGFNDNKLVGIDCCKEVVDICVQKGYFVYEGDILKLDTSSWHFDIIFIIHTLEHVPNPEIVVEKCTELLNPDGFIFVEVPIQQYEDPELWGHYHTFGSHDKVKEFFQDYDIIKEDWQKTQSKKPWYRVLFQKR